MGSDSKNASKHYTSLVKRQSTLFKKFLNLDVNSIPLEAFLSNCVELLNSHWIYESETAFIIHYNGSKYQGDHQLKDVSLENTFEEKQGDLALSIDVYTKNKRELSGEEIDLVKIILSNIGSKSARIKSRIRLNQKQARLDKAYKLARIGTWEYDMINDKLFWTDMTKEVHGFEKDYIPDVESTVALFKEGYHRDTFAEAASNAIEHNIPFDIELKIISGKGDERWIRATGEPEYEEGVCTRFYGISQNVTGRRKAEEEVELNNRRFKALVKHGMDMIAILDEDANYNFVSQTSKNVLGLKPGFFLGKNAFDLIHDEDLERIRRQFSKLKPTESAQVSAFRFLDEDNNWRWLEATLTNLTNDPAVKGYVSNSRDITERQLKQEEILDSLKEKETLLSEIHHRIKNNLSVLTGMLQLQAAQENNEEVIKRLFDSVARINTMASIHELLYKTNDFSGIELSERIKLLAQHINKSMTNTTEVSMDFQCEPVDLTVEYALPCCLIFNEAFTNIFKHAFIGRASGKIKITLEKTDVSDFMKLTISDDGNGLPEDFDPAKSDSLGLTLIKMLSEQIQANYFYQSDSDGTSFNLLFKKDNG
jgi:PAS domain S-box-containing protein